MSNYNDNSSWSDKFSWIITIVAMVLVAILSIGLLCALFIQPNEDEQDEQAEVQQISVMDGEGNAMDADTVYAMPEAMSFSAASLAQARAQFNEPSGTTITSDESVDVRIEAYVRPDDAANKKVDFSVSWGTAPTHGSEPVENYLTVTPDSDGSTTATVSCKKAFGDDTILITVTTREGGFQATCTVTFTGVADGISISGSTATKKSTSGRGEYYEVGTSKTYTFDISLTNAFDDVASDLSVKEIGGEGTMYFFNGYSNDAGYYVYSETFQKDLSEIASKFITSATISGNTLTIKTGSKILENYYDYSAPDEYHIVEMLYDRYLVEVRDDLMGYKDVGESFNNQNAKYNAEHIDDCYFYVTVEDEISGLTQTVKLWLVSSVSGVSLSPSEIEF